MSVLYLNVCRLCLPNIMSLGACFKKLRLVKDGALAWYSVNIRVVIGVGLERRKVDKKANLHENWSMQALFQSLEYFSQMSSKMSIIILRYTVSKLVCFFARHSVYWEVPALSSCKSSIALIVVLFTLAFACLSLFLLCDFFRFNYQSLLY